MVITKCKTKDDEWLESSGIRRSLTEAIETQEYLSRPLSSEVISCEVIGIFAKLDVWPEEIVLKAQQKINEELKRILKEYDNDTSN